MRPPSIATSASRAGAAVPSTTVPPRMTRSCIGSVVGAPAAAGQRSSGHRRCPRAMVPAMQDHSFAFEVAATPKEIWAVFWQRRNRVVEHGDVRIEYLHWGDDTGEGRIRHCHFRVPRYLLSGGVGRLGEWLREVKPCESCGYDATGKPLWSRGTGW